MYTIEQLESDINGIVTDLAKMRKAKGHDYSGTEDTFDNLREFGSRGVLVRIGDKFKRLKHFYSQGELSVKDETVLDTMRDLINYALFLFILHQQEQQSSKNTANRPVRLYFAGAVRGVNGDDCEPQDVQRNVDNALERVKYLRSHLDDRFVIYCPHEHEDRYQQAWRKGLFKSQDVLDQCCDIVLLCDAILVTTDPARSEGTRVERALAEQTGMPVIDLYEYNMGSWIDMIHRGTE